MYSVHIEWHQNERRMMTIFYFRRTNIAGKLYTKHTSIWFSQVAFVYDRYSSNGNGNGSDTVLHLIICGYLTNDKKGKRVRNGTKTRQRWGESSICHNGTNERKTVHTISNDSKYTHTHSHTLTEIHTDWTKGNFAFKHKKFYGFMGMGLFTFYEYYENERMKKKIAMNKLKRRMEKRRRETGQVQKHWKCWIEHRFGMCRRFWKMSVNEKATPRM